MEPVAIRERLRSETAELPTLGNHEPRSGPLSLCSTLPGQLLLVAAVKGTLGKFENRPEHPARLIRAAACLQAHRNAPSGPRDLRRRWRPSAPAHPRVVDIHVL